MFRFSRGARPFTNLAALLQKHGVRGTAGILSHRASERFHEWRLGIASAEVIPLTQFGISDARFHEHVPTTYRTFRQAMRMAGVNPGDVFVDYGSGLGRAVVLAATYPFARVIGIDLIPELNVIAERNLTRARASGRLRCTDVELIIGDATRFIPPPDATTMFFFNPFGEEILSAVMNNIRSRTMDRTVIYISPGTTTRLDRIAHQFPWLVETRRENRADEGTITIYRAKAGAAAPSAAATEQLLAREV